MERWAGIDVGAERKGFHLAVICAEGAAGSALRVEIARFQTVELLVEALAAAPPAAMAIDSPQAPAGAGERSRADERAFRAAGVCGIRFTPDEATLQTSDYYAWIRHGLRLHAALASHPILQRVPTVECFPTAAWTRWHGPRGQQNRAKWSQEALQLLPLVLPPRLLSQDDRDAVAAAYTALLLGRHTAGDPVVERFGALAIPLRPLVGRQD